MAQLQNIDGQMHLREAWPKIKSNDEAMNAELAEHDQRITNIVAGAGDSNTEIVDARQPASGSAYPVLKDRLDASDAQLADLAIQLKPNGVDDTEVMQAAVDTIRDRGGGTILLTDTDGYYNVTSAIIGCSNLKVVGGKSKPFVKNLTDDVFNLFYFEDESNIEFENVSFQNGIEALDGEMIGSAAIDNQKCAISFNNCSGIKIHDCYTTEMSGYTGYAFLKSNDIHVYRNRFYRHTYAMLSIREESEDIFIYQNEFDTVTGQTDGVSYTINTGSSDFTTLFEYGVKNLHVYENKILNNPEWEGIDTHGCIGFYCHDNYIENVRMGIMAAYDDRPNRPFTHGDIYIERNVIIRGTGVGVGNGIIVTGNSGGNGEQADNVRINKNRITGEFGRFDANTVGGINIDCVKNFTVNYNELYGCVNKAFVIASCTTGDMIGNKILESNVDNSGNYIPVRFFAGCYLINFEKNVIKNINNPKLTIGVHNTNRGLVIYNGNYIEATTEFNVVNAQLNGTVSSSAKMGKKGHYVKDTYGLVKYWCTDTVIKSIALLTALTVSGTAGSKTITSSARALIYLCPGEEFVIAGAGTAGADLTTRLAEYIDNTTFTITDDIVTTVTDAAVTTVDSTWVNS